MSSFFSKSCSVYEASSAGSSSASLLISKEKKSRSTSSEKDYSVAYGSLTSHYGASGQAPIQVPLPQSQPQSQPQAVQKVRAKEFGAQQNKYGAIGHGSMTSGI